ncbi:porin family protein [Chryseobacterium sp. ES2]|uniref:Porin family protein n=1 Tax=Chryseobacterium metallicongregator TaxID=3073042 RepID=A0ABU1E6A6_9FLAO|nr:porin family protein [Chryseobacterium sp. ES2]MDR4953338.1 porin family protein [Chryseobacterium sp. ES2]
MKKQLLSVCIVIGTMAFAQSTGGPKFGVKAGGNLSSISGSDTKSKLGFYAGAFVNIPISEVFSIQPEVVYSQQGTKAKDKYLLGAIPVKDIKQILNYINVPVMIQYNATPKFYLEAGPEFGFLINAKAKEYFLGESLSWDNKSLLSTFNFGLGIGLGYKFIPSLGVNVRYIAGLTKIVKDDAEEPSKNTNLQLGVNYYF